MKNYPNIRIHDIGRHASNSLFRNDLNSTQSYDRCLPWHRQFCKKLIDSEWFCGDHNGLDT